MKNQSAASHLTVLVYSLFHGWKKSAKVFTLHETDHIHLSLNLATTLKILEINTYADYIYPEQEESLPASSGKYYKLQIQYMKWLKGHGMIIVGITNNSWNPTELMKAYWTYSMDQERIEIRYHNHPTHATIRPKTFIMTLSK